MAASEATPRTLISRAQINRPRGKRLYWLMVIAVTILFTLIFIGPLYWMVTGALKSPRELTQTPPALLPSHPEFGNFGTAWTRLGLGRSLANTLYYAFGALAFQLAFDVAAAYSFSKLRPVFGKAILGLMLVMMMIPATVLVVPQYVNILNLPIVHLDLIDTPFAIWLPSVANAFSIFLLKRFFDSIPDDLMAAAAIDGASPMRALRSIVMPMSRPILGVVSIFAVTAVWKDFLWPLLVEELQFSKEPINVAIYSQAAGIPQNIVIAGAAIAAVPTILFFLVFQKNIMSGLTTGGLKG